MNEPTAVKTAETVDTAATEHTETKQGAKSFSQDEVNAIVQKRLAEEKAKNTEMAKAQTDFEEREKARSEREKAIELSEREFKAKNILSQNGYSHNFLEFINCSDDDTMNASINKLFELVTKHIGNQKSARIIDTGLDHGGCTAYDDNFMRGFKH